MKWHALIWLIAVLLSLPAILALDLSGSNGVYDFPDLINVTNFQNLILQKNVSLTECQQMVGDSQFCKNIDLDDDGNITWNEITFIQNNIKAYVLGMPQLKFNNSFSSGMTVAECEASSIGAIDSRSNKTAFCELLDKDGNGNITREEAEAFYRKTIPEVVPLTIEECVAIEKQGSEYGYQNFCQALDMDNDSQITSGDIQSFNQTLEHFISSKSISRSDCGDDPFCKAATENGSVTFSEAEDMEEEVEDQIQNQGVKLEPQEKEETRTRTGGGSPTVFYTSASTVCIPNWSCGEWSACSPEGRQERICQDLNNCLEPKTEYRECEYVPPAEEKVEIENETIEQNQTEEIPAPQPQPSLTGRFLEGISSYWWAFGFVIGIIFLIALLR